MNTPGSGKVRCIVFEEEGVWYGAVLELNIVESGDDFDVVMFNMNEAIRGYLETVASMKLSKFPMLNQEADPEYEKLWTSLQSQGPVKSPYNVKYYGFAAV